MFPKLCRKVCVESKKTELILFVEEDSPGSIWKGVARSSQVLLKLYKDRNEARFCEIKR